jgi:hypothetical protein
MTTVEIRPTNQDDLIDSRDVIARIEDLEQAARNAYEEDRAEEAPEDLDAVLWLDDEDAAELRALRSLAEEAAPYAADWQYGETLIRDSYFRQYAEEQAEEWGLLQSGARWPYTCIDWDRAARELRMDYTSVDFDGVDYWIR